MTTVLAVEDDPRSARLLSEGLSGAGHDVTVASCGETAIELTRSAPFGAIILDAALPGMDGLETCRCLRASGDRTPVLMLTARRTVEDRVEGLDAGADDYMTKPYHLDEVLARLRALERRVAPDDSDLVTVGPLVLDVDGAMAWRCGEEVTLTGREARILDTLMAEAGRVVTRSSIAEQAWEGTLVLRSNVVDVHIRSLRRKIDDPFGVHSIETVRGMGYRLRRDGGT